MQPINRTLPLANDDKGIHKPSVKYNIANKERF